MRRDSRGAAVTSAALVAGETEPGPTTATVRGKGRPAIHSRAIAPLHLAHAFNRASAVLVRLVIDVHSAASSMPHNEDGAV